MGEEVDGELGGEGGGEEDLQRGKDGAGLRRLRAEQLRLDDVGEEAGEDEDGDEALDQHARVELAEAVAHPPEDARSRLLEHDGVVGFRSQAGDPFVADFVRFGFEIVGAPTVVSLLDGADLNYVHWFGGFLHE